MRYKVLLLIFLVFAVLHFVAGPVLCNLYNKQAERLLGFPTSVDKVSVDLLNRMVTMKHLTVSSGPQKKENLFTIDTAVISFHLVPLLSRKIRVEELSLNDVRVNFRENKPLLEQLSRNVASQYAVMQQRLQRTHTPDLPRAPYAIKQAAYGHDVVYRIVKADPTLVVDTLKVTNISIDFGRSEEEPRPPSLTDIDLTVRYLTPEPFLASKDTSFEFSGKLSDQSGSHLSLNGSCRQRKEGFSMTSALSLQNIELPDLWPYLIGIMKDPDLSSLVVNAGVADLTAEIAVEEENTNIDATAHFIGLRLASARGFEQEPLAGKDRRTIIDAINSVGDFSITFNDYEQWKKAFREVVMKGVRNLIRKAIMQKLFGG